MWLVGWGCSGGVVCGCLGEAVVVVWCGWLGKDVVGWLVG